MSTRIPLGIFWWYFVENAKQAETMCHIQEWQLCLSYCLCFHSLLYLTVIMHCFCVHSVSWTPFGIFLWCLGRNVEQDKPTCHIQEWQLWLSYFWSYLALCLNLILCPLCNMNTLRNILMILGRNVVQYEMTCCIQEWQLWLSYFLSYLPFLYLSLILCPLFNSNTLWIVSILLSRNVEQDETTCCIQKKITLAFLLWDLSPRLVFELDFVSAL